MVFMYKGYTWMNKLLGVPYHLVTWITNPGLSAESPLSRVTFATEHLVTQRGAGHQGLKKERITNHVPVVCMYEGKRLEGVSP